MAWCVILTKYSPFKRVEGSIRASCRSHFNTISLLDELKSFSSKSMKAKKSNVTGRLEEDSQKYKPVVLLISDHLVPGE